MNQGDPSPSDAAKDQSRLLTNADIEALRGINGNIQAQLVNKQDILRSGVNIKTINSQSLLGGGDLIISSETYWGDILGNIIDQTDLVVALDAKQDLLVNQVNIRSINGISLLGSGDIIIGGGPTPTLDEVTDAGNTTTNSISVGGLNVDSGVLYVDPTNNRVGINRLTPDYPLDVQMTEPTKGLVVRRHNSAAQFIHIHEADGSGHWITANQDKPFYIENQALNYPLVFRTSSTERMQITSGGNVLIGTTVNSTYKLDVSGTARVSGNFTVSTSSLFVNTSNNRVGINTLIPSYELDVTGSIRSTLVSRLAGLIVERSDTSENVIQITQATGAAAAHLYSRGNGYLGWIGIRGTSGTRRFAFESNPGIDSGSHFGLVMYDSAGTNSLTNWTATRTLFTVAQTFRTNTDTYLSATSGRVGIGISPVGAKLTVLAADETSDGAIAIQTPGATYLKLGGNSTYSWIQTFNSKPLYINALGNNVVFSGVGNVLIGTTTSSTYKLDVNGTFRTTGKVVLNNPTGNNRPLEVSSNEIVVADFRNTGNTNAYLDIIGSGGSSTQMRLGVFGTNVGITRGADNDPDIVINPSNNIGIGTITPQSRLHVEGGNVNFNLIAPTGNPTFRMADSVTSVTRKEFTIIVDNTNNRVDMQAIQQGVGFRPIALNPGGGNVGIGTGIPKTKLQINGGHLAAYYTVGSNGAQLYLGDINFDNPLFWDSAPGIGAIVSPAQGVAGNLAFYTYTGISNSRTERMRIADGGNVLIGTTTNAGFKLDVNGDINSTAYFVNGVAGYTGMLVIPTNPPGQQNIDIQRGIIVNIF
jgi:hypothetical protein